jgi:hypothetical protein
MARKITSIRVVFDLDGEIVAWFHGIKAARDYVTRNARAGHGKHCYRIVRFVPATP